ncbi:MAG: peptide chain release factor 2, partial [Pseudobdellovibrionaceae bacterium]|nr:peptide chain release factor 2 [Pseudobdellovibrionaceae bacterium]
EIEARPDFWSNPKLSAPILKKKRALELAVNRAKVLTSTRDDLNAALELAEEGSEEYIGESVRLLELLEKELQALEIQSLLGGEVDGNDAILTINSGAGGTESCDWASMLFRMYLRYAERKGWETEVHDLQDGDEAGIKSATIEVRGPYAFGLLKAESGVHRLVRISPYDSNARRHTSFASVYVSPIVDDNIEITIVDSDLRIDTYRASGAGGQHVNRTDSAVRITHMPSGIVVACQTQRSQHQNRDQAMKILKSRLYERELETRKAAQAVVEGNKSDVSFGSQIRSYVLHPYKLVKDHRTDHESFAPDEVLDGSIDTFINEFLGQQYKTPGE